MPPSRDVRAALTGAAVDLYEEHGFDATTVAAVAGRAGVTERTFFRYFTDKREVLFANESGLAEELAAAVAAAPGPTDIRTLVLAGLDAVTARLQPRRQELCRRERIVGRHPALQEREQLKLASWTAVLEQALVTRGVPQPAARLGAAVGVAVLDTAARDWMARTDGRPLAAVLDRVVADVAQQWGAPSA